MIDEFKMTILNRAGFAVIHVKSKIDAETSTQIQKTIDKAISANAKTINETH